MKFGKRMNDEMVKAWRAYYVSYKRFKQLVKNKTLVGPDFHKALVACAKEELSKAEKHFFSLLEELQALHDELIKRKDVEDEETSVKNDTPLIRAQKTPSNSSVNTPTHLARSTNSPNPALVRRNFLHHENNNSFGSQPVDTDEDHAAVSVRPSEPGYTRVSGEGEQPQQPTTHIAPSFWETIRKSFLGIVGDSHRKEVRRSGQEEKTDYIDWFTTARRLIRFAELNLEALRKASKKVKKYRSEDGDFVLEFENYIQNSSLTTLLPKLYTMVENVKSTFKERFDSENLEQFEDVTMASGDIWHAKWRYVFMSVALFLFSLTMPMFEFHGPAHRCLALFVLVISMWVTEAIPFFCTAMLIPLIAVPLGILEDPVTGLVADPVVAARVILSRVFNHVQILVLGGLTMAKAIAKVRLEVAVTAKLHAHTAHRPGMWLLGVMVLSCVLCTFVSNVAAPLLVLSVIQPTLWELPVDAPEAPKGILLGLAFACNLGGMMSPIASPQNAVALQTVVLHHFDFTSWIAVVLPIVSISLGFAWWFIMRTTEPFKNVKFIPYPITSGKTAPAKKEIVLVGLVCLMTVVLWCLPPSLFFGDTGIIALIPIVVFFGVGVLKKDDFNSLPWHLMFLLAGGNMLGQCAQDSKLLDIVSAHLRRELVAFSPYQTMIFVCIVVCVIATFLSHTVTAMVILPVISSLGTLFASNVGHHHTAHAVASYFHIGNYLSWQITPEAIVFSAALMCSGAMAFPISSFPNVNSLLAEDEMGQPYLKAGDFLLPGITLTILSLLLLVVLVPPLVNGVLLLSASTVGFKI